MNADELERLLRRWGRVFGTAPPREWDEDSSGSLGALTSVLMSRMHVGIGSQAGEKQKRPVWIDPETGAVIPNYIPGVRRITARGKESASTMRPWNPDTDAEFVELAALDLYRYDRMRGVVIRLEYCCRGHRQKDKAAWVGACEGIDERITLRRYRHELDFARQWMAGRLFGTKIAA